MSCAVAMYQSSFHAASHHYPSSTAVYPQRTSTITSADAAAAAAGSTASVSPHRAIDDKRQRLHEHLYRATTASASSGGATNFSLKPSPSSPALVTTPSSPTTAASGGATRGGATSGGVSAGDSVESESSQEQHQVKYISSSCMLVTYYKGDVANIVDDHFSKALTMTSTETVLPMSQRNLPPSFWDSNSYTPRHPHASYPSTSSTSAAAAAAAADSYHAAALAGLSQPPPPPHADWYYHPSLAAASHQSYATPAPPHNLTYGAAAAAAAAAGASRYNQYPSLLLQSAAAGRFGMQQSSSGLDSSSYGSYMYSSGLEGTPMSEPAAKDLYWFQ